MENDVRDRSRPGGLYNKRYSAEGMARLAQAGRQGSAGNIGMANQLSLDELVAQGSGQEQRRHSLQQRMLDTGQAGGAGSMMDFNSSAHNDLDGYSFASSPISRSPNLMNSGGMGKQGMNPKSQQHASIDRGLGVDTSMADFGVSMDPMAQSPLFHGGFGGDQMNMDASNGGMMDLHMDGSYDDAMDTGLHAGMDMFPQPDFGVSMQSPLDGDHNSTRMHGQDPGGGFVGGMDQVMMDKMPHMSMGNGLNPLASNAPAFTGAMANPAMEASMPNPGGRTVGMGRGGMMPDSQSQPGFPGAPGSQEGFGPQQALSGTQQQALSQYLNAYSQSGFDMLGILMRVAARPKPQINIGAVDMSCAFVVCDVKQHDIPIVYCSEMFERLTGYVKHEILGRNCRFLQSPDGKIVTGVKRKYVDDKSVFYLKNMVMQRQEAQISLINYRKGGQPFMNLLTMIPITWDSDEIRYFVGFQVDLVEQPTSITNKNPDGSYSINYQRGLLPRYVINKTPESQRSKELESGHSIERDEVTSILTTFGTTDSEYSKRIWDKVLIENTDDVVHVLSLKGLFLYLSPASKKILEYEPSELIGTPLSSVCHPSDIVPVTRELKDSAPNSTVNVVFRIRRKHSGYTWFESHGSLHTEQGKGKKCIILTGRERPVYALQRKGIVSVQEIGENELWTKMSTSGMFLFVSTHVKSLLDRQPEDLVGSSIQTLMRRESKEDFNRMLEMARSGKIVTLKHDIQNRRGQTLHAQSTLYPGDAVEGEKPTFLIVQTKLLKLTRAPAGKSSSTGHPSPASGSQSASGMSPHAGMNFTGGVHTTAGGGAFAVGSQHEALASEDNVFDELKTTRSTSWQFELRQMEKRNRVLAEELQSLNSSKKKRKRRKGMGQLQKDCANCHTRNTPEWRRGPSGNRDLCNSCGLRWAKQNGRVSPRASSQQSDRTSASPANSSPPHPSAKHDHSSSPAGNTKTAQERAMASHKDKASRREAQSKLDYGGGVAAAIEEGDEPPDG